MRWLGLIVLLVLLLGPLRRWAGRHWALLLSAAGGAIAGLILASALAAMGNVPPYTPLVAAVVGAVAFGRAGPGVLRRLEKDGRHDRNA